MHLAAAEALVSAPGAALARSGLAFVPTDVGFPATGAASVASAVSASGRLVLAGHPIITAVPFFVPTFVVAAVIGIVIWRDRRRGRQEGEPEGADGAPGASDGTETADHPEGP
ncbi:hypothetical protein A8924_1563 [Saccharopolyspora erythraea NRRL 2338]|uniref:Uncharacterized protein n=2 Tax=Saccharopolyspora erythraea TaxID=1836 RepID=A4F8X0_SACEN|nr:hypothetical protein [Saccharopolyspora erythraea]EQD86767.1 hypothetical protein N599_07805 [Saccharopolyspora erythraea D]PFG94292.1 hypothetical protein A8924_1563 [Saccharopolyspora erythraea NRRL 2338]QRK91062.1 hypothetical protein JQX30_06365 [Saccharopolyspora erythraea]CAM00495.1 hypothetical protein SACE_1167 [Saccharopolyspora erythraea NRRL 2338]